MFKLSLSSWGLLQLSAQLASALHLLILPAKQPLAGTVKQRLHLDEKKPVSNAPSINIWAAEDSLT